PGMNGRQLAEIAKTLRPALNILFVTGYAETAAHRGEFLGQGMDMITKPFAIQTLAFKVGELIGPGTR
ncbi:MAG: response regulator, partial [Oxalobacteraceae bacterium]